MFTLQLNFLYLSLLSLLSLLPILPTLSSHYDKSSRASNLQLLDNKANNDIHQHRSLDQYRQAETCALLLHSW